MKKLLAFHFRSCQVKPNLVSKAEFGFSDFDCKNICCQKIFNLIIVADKIKTYFNFAQKIDLVDPSCPLSECGSFYEKFHGQDFLFQIDHHKLLYIPTILSMIFCLDASMKQKKNLQNICSIQSKTGISTQILRHINTGIQNTNR